jgi:hypothetical protein
MHEGANFILGTFWGHRAGGVAFVLLGTFGDQGWHSNPSVSGGVWKGKKNKNDHHLAEGEQHGPGSDN